MQLEFHGVRGSFPAPGADRARYGGHTTCASLRLGPNDYLVVDAGTGLRDLGERIMAEAGNAEVRVDLLLTHFHLDHVLGFRSSRRSSRPGPRSPSTRRGTRTETRRRAGRADGRPLLSRRARPDGGPEGVPASSSPGRSAAGSAFRPVRSAIPRACVAYRLEAEERSFVLAVDTEHPDNGLGRPAGRLRRGRGHARLRRDVHAGGIRSRKEGLGPLDLAGRDGARRRGPGRSPRPVPLQPGPHRRRGRPHPRGGPRASARDPRGGPGPAARKGISDGQGPLSGMDALRPVPSDPVHGRRLHRGRGRSGRSAQGLRPFRGRDGKPRPRSPPASSFRSPFSSRRSGPSSRP
ncbi:MAG: MBL fold metallo-hydrolase [Ignavibacteriales bacterium]|nr:MBL fold metallo-hydrolase [Ignavibacteriales bacterium]